MDQNMKREFITEKDIKLPNVVSKSGKRENIANAMELEIEASGNLGRNNYQRGLEEILMFHMKPK